VKGNSDAWGVTCIAWGVDCIGWTFESIAWGVESTTAESIDKLNQDNASSSFSRSFIDTDICE
jgi:glycosyltransferase A (GT-A) superfamily protein (DUF2064 family)